MIINGRIVTSRADLRPDEAQVLYIRERYVEHPSERWIVQLFAPNDPAWISTVLHGDIHPDIRPGMFDQQPEMEAAE